MCHRHELNTCFKILQWHLMIHTIVTFTFFVFKLFTMDKCNIHYENNKLFLFQPVPRRWLLIHTKIVQIKMYPEWTTDPTLDILYPNERSSEINSIGTSSFISSMQKPFFMGVLIILGTIGIILNAVLLLPLRKNPTNSNK